MNIVSAFDSEKSRKEFISKLPPSIGGKFDADILIPVVINTRQLTALSDHHKLFLRSNQKPQYLTAIWQHATDASNGPYKYIITSLWAVKHDVKLYKKVGTPFPVMVKWFNTEEGREIISKFVSVKEFDINDITKYIHYANIYLTKDKAYVLHFKGQQ